MVEFSTVRELEKRSFHVFEYGAGAFLGGLLLTLLGVPMIGVPLLTLAALAIIAAIVWVTMIGKESSRPLFCPHCSSKNDVFLSRRDFNCDICGRAVVVSENGEALMAEAIDTEARYDR